MANDATVTTAYKDVLTCLSDMGYEKIKPELLFPWQALNHPDEYTKGEIRYTAEEKEYFRELAEPSPVCQADWAV